MKRTIFVLLLPLLSFVACGPKEDPLEREKKEMKESLESTEALIYRGLKITLRSLPANALDSSKKQQDATKIQALTLSLLSKALGMAGNDSAFSVTEYIGLVKEVSSLKDQLGDTDEDRYPTILEIFLASGNAADKKEFAWYNNSYEHLILAMAWAGAKAPRAFRVYETSKIEPSAIGDPSVALMASFIRGSTFHLEKWDHSSEAEFTWYLDHLEKERRKITAFMLQQELLKSEKKTEQQAYSELRAIGLGMRGIVRLQIEKEDDAMDDLDGFISEARTAGIDNEALWAVGTYVSLKKERKDSALMYLGKLEKSSLLGGEEKEVVAEVKKYVEARESGKAMNKVFDKVFIAKVLSLEVKRRSAAVDWYGQISKSETGNKFLGFSDQLRAEYENIARHTDGGSLKEQAKGLLDKITN